MIALRDYQVECLEAVRREWRTVNRTLVVMATGTGKTIVFLALLDDLLKEQPNARALVLSHRVELVRQPIEKAEQYYPSLAPKCGVVMAAEDDASAQIVVATVQTLNSGDRLKRCGHFEYCILDECHHAPSSSYVKVLDAMPGTKILGMTATPMRTDGDGLRKVFQSLAYRLPIDRAIERGALVPFDALGFGLPVRLAGLKETADGWDNEPLGDLLKADNCLEIVLDKWREHASDRLTMLYTASVAQAHATAAYFSARGVPAEAVDGGTPKDTRAGVLERFKTGETRLVANCQVWTEGVDVPEIGCVAMVCPTKSDLAYVQKMGRGLRTVPGKSDCLVLDFAPLEGRNVIMAGDVLGVPRDLAKATKAAEDVGILLGALHVDNYGLVTTIDPTEVTVRLLNYMRHKSSLAWVLEDNLAVATLSQDRTLVMLLPDAERIAREEAKRRSGDWSENDQRLLDALCSVRVVMLTKTAPRRWDGSLVGQYPTFQEAQGDVSELARMLTDPNLAKRSKSWRQAPASEPQIRFGRSLGIDGIAQMSRGKASQSISFAIASQQATRWAMGWEAGRYNA